jgi:hypothetical protein
MNMDIDSNLLVDVDVDVDVEPVWPFPVSCCFPDTCLAPLLY